VKTPRNWQARRQKNVRFVWNWTFNCAELVDYAKKLLDMRPYMCDKEATIEDETGLSRPVTTDGEMTFRPNRSRELCLCFETMTIWHHDEWCLD
jgi:hypothetical protein